MIESYFYVESGSIDGMITGFSIKIGKEKEKGL